MIKINYINFIVIKLNLTLILSIFEILTMLKFHVYNIYSVN